MRSTAALAVEPTLLGAVNSIFSAQGIKFAVRSFKAVKIGGKRLAITACAAPSGHTAFRRRDMLSATAAASILLLPSINFANAATDSSEDSLLREEIAEVLSKQKAAGLLRLVFHDAGTFDVSDQTGGMNGSIVHELGRPENFGLEKSIKVLEKVKVKIDAVKPVSWADLIALAGAEAVSVCGGPKIRVELGRLDASVPDPDGKLPEETLDATAMKQNFERKGFSAQELVALSGAHTLGSKGFGSPFVFDNSYYKILLEKPWNSGGMSSMVGLPSDRALADDEECIRWISKYADDQNLFFEDFKNVYIKLVNTGAKWKSL